MADFVAVLKKTMDGLSDTAPLMREKVYEKARITIASKLNAMNPPLPSGVIEKQKQALEDAIVQVEAEFKRKSADPLTELESVFASLKNPDPRAVLRTPAPKPAPAAAPPSVAPAPAVPSSTLFVPPPANESRRPEPRAISPEADDFDTQQPFPPGPIEREEIAEEQEPRRRGYGRLIAAVVVLAILGGGGYGAWLIRHEFEEVWANAKATSSDLLAKWTTPEQEQPAEQPPASDVAAVEPAPAETLPLQPTPEVAAPGTTDAGPPKFTQRLNPDGTESDAGPAAGQAAIGEGTSVAAVTQPSVPSPQPTEPPATVTPAEPPTVDAPAAAQLPDAESPAPGMTPDVPAASGEAPGTAETPPSTDTPPGDTTPPATAETGQPTAPAEETPDATAEGQASPPVEPTPTAQQEQSIPVGQRAIFYEERTNVADASAEPGSIVWSLVQESPGGDQPPEPAIRAEATIPGKDVQLRITIRRNADRTLPASHIVEMIFLTPQGFEGGGIENVLRISLKSSEQEAGSPLLGIPAKIADGFFLIALNDTKPEIDANTNLLRSQSWIDVPVQYKSGRRALFTMEKGIPGAKVFDEAIKAWQAASSG